MGYYDCCACLAGPLNRAKRKGILEHLLIFVLLRPYECRHCRSRFLRFGL